MFHTITKEDDNINNKQNMTRVVAFMLEYVLPNARALIEIGARPELRTTARERLSFPKKVVIPKSRSSHTAATPTASSPPATGNCFDNCYFVMIVQK